MHSATIARNMAAVVLVLGLAALAPATRAQGVSAADMTEEESVLAVVQGFFDAMTARDADAGKNTLMVDGQYYGVMDGSDGLRISMRTHEDWLEKLPGRESTPVERLWDPTVLIHERIAVVWAPYDFHIDGKFSHCGMDAFTLVKTKDGWRITNAAFTMEPKDCEPSPLGPLGAAAE